MSTNIVIVISFLTFTLLEVYSLNLKSIEPANYYDVPGNKSKGVGFTSNFMLFKVSPLFQTLLNQNKEIKAKEDLVWIAEEKGRVELTVKTRTKFDVKIVEINSKVTNRNLENQADENEVIHYRPGVYQNKYLKSHTDQGLQQNKISHLVYLYGIPSTKKNIPVYNFGVIKRVRRDSTDMSKEKEERKAKKRQEKMERKAKKEQDRAERKGKKEQEKKERKAKKNQDKGDKKSKREKKKVTKKNNDMHGNGTSPNYNEHGTGTTPSNNVQGTGTTARHNVQGNGSSPNYIVNATGTTPSSG